VLLLSLSLPPCAATADAAAAANTHTSPQDLSKATLKAKLGALPPTDPVLIEFFASWCVFCARPQFVRRCDARACACMRAWRARRHSCACCNDQHTHTHPHAQCCLSVVDRAPSHAQRLTAAACAPACHALHAAGAQHAGAGFGARAVVAAGACG
jgi:thiol-disulfide isomerase/thioredoxin